jgi:hypothetical protein
MPKVLNDEVLLLLIVVGIDQMAIYNRLYKVPQCFRINHFSLYISNIREYTFTEQLLLGTFVGVKINIENLG